VSQKYDDITKGPNIVICAEKVFLGGYMLVKARVVDPDPAGSEIICMFGSKCSRFPTYGTVAISIKENRFKELSYVFFIVKI
jgi:hypothetical protein